jgi:hypothetical protein
MYLNLKEKGGFKRSFLEKISTLEGKINRKKKKSRKRNQEKELSHSLV